MRIGTALIDNLIKTVVFEDNGVRAIDSNIDSIITSFDTTPQRIMSGDLVVDYQLLAPIPKPLRNIMCVGLNYYAHGKEFSGASFERPEVPIVFTKSTNTVVGHGANIDGHFDLTQELDYEAEVAVVIGKTGSNIPVESALDYVFGYMLLNDVTGRDLQRKGQQWFKGKTLDTWCPMGPFIVTSDEIPDPESIELSCFVGEELRQQASVRDMIFSIPEIISYLSQGMTLEPGDIIATGTPPGVGMSFNPKKFLASGDMVTIQSPQLGLIRNKITDGGAGDE